MEPIIAFLLVCLIYQPVAVLASVAALLYRHPSRMPGPYACLRALVLGFFAGYMAAVGALYSGWETPGVVLAVGSCGAAGELVMGAIRKRAERAAERAGPDV